MKNDHYIIGLGASAGGLQSLKQFFIHLPYDLDAVFVVVTHLPIDYETRLDHLLQGATSLPVILLKEDIVPKKVTSIFCLAN